MLESTSKHVKIIIEYIFEQINIFRYHTNCICHEISTNVPGEMETLTIEHGKLDEYVIM